MAAFPGRPQAGTAGHSAHVPSEVRTVAGPLVETSPEARVQFEAGLGVDPADPQAAGPVLNGIPTGEKVVLTFRLADPETGAPLSGLAPTAQLRETGAPQAPVAAQAAPVDPFEVRETYALIGPSGDVGVLEAGEHASHTPGASLARAYGASFTAMVKLPGPIAEAVADLSGRYLFVSLPKNGLVGVIDALSRRLVHTVPAGKQPFHVAAEPTGKRIWVGGDGDGTVTSLDVETHEARTIAVGSGHHAFAFSKDGRLVFVSNSRSGSVSVLDAERGERLAEVSVGGSPHGLDYSAATGRLYVANEAAGAIGVLAVEGERVTPVATIPAGAGTMEVRIHPAGRVGVASNHAAGTLTVFDAASNAVLKTVRAGQGPGAIVFLEDYALVRNELTPDVTYVNLANPDIADEIPIGTEPPLAVAESHTGLFLGPTGEDVLVPDPVAGQIYTVHVMHGQPMVMGQTKVAAGAGFLVSLVNRVREIAPGVYQRVVRFDRAGSYDLEIAPGGSRQAVRFTLEVADSRPEKVWAARPLLPTEPYVAGRESVVRYQVSGIGPEAASGPADDGVITVYRLTPGQGIWQRVLKAEHAGDGVYQARVQFPEPGAYSMTFTSTRLGLTSKDSPPVSVQVVER